MRNGILYQSLQLHKRIFLSLCVLELVHGLLILVAAWSVTHILARWIPEMNYTQEPASDFLMLAFVLLAITLVHHQQRNRQRSLSDQVRSDCRHKLHTSLLTQEQDPLTFLPAALETIDALDSWFTVVLPCILSLVILVPMILVAAVVQDPLTALIFMVTVPIAPFLLYLIGQLTHSASERQWHELQQLSGGFQELLHCMLTLKLFRQSKAQQERLRELSQSFCQASLQVLKLAFVSSFALELITTLSIALIAVNIGLRLLNGALTFPTAFFLLLLAPEFYQPLRQGGSAFHSAMTTYTAEKSLHHFLNSCDSQLDGQHKQLQVPPTIRTVALSFHYPDTQALVLQDLDLTFPANHTTVLTGPNGAGKTTLLRLLAGLSQPTAGHVLLNEVPLDQLAPDSCHKLVSYVPQEPHLFTASLADNVSLFQPVPHERIRQALRLSSLEEWVSHLPAGLDTRLGTDGVSISNGQCHRLGLARAIIQNRPIVLMDEPTAGLDEATEQQVLLALSAFCRHRTMILVSHRPAVMAWADHQIELSCAKEEQL